MEKKEVQEGWDFWMFQNEMMTDFTLFEEEYYYQSALIDHAQELQDFMPEVILDDMIGSLDNGLTGQLEPSTPHPHLYVEEKVGKDGQLENMIKENERSFSSNVVDPCLQSFHFETSEAGDHVEKKAASHAPSSGTSSNSKRKRTKGWKDSPEGIKLRVIAKEEQKIRNRITAARSYAKKQDYIKDLEVRCGELHRENVIRKKVLKFLEISMMVGTHSKRLKRSNSGPISSYTPL